MNGINGQVFSTNPCKLGKSHHDLNIKSKGICNGSEIINYAHVQIAAFTGGVGLYYLCCLILYVKKCSSHIY